MALAQSWGEDDETVGPGPAAASAATPYRAPQIRQVVEGEAKEPEETFRPPTAAETAQWGLSPAKSWAISTKSGRPVELGPAAGAPGEGKPLPAWAATPYEKQVGIYGQLANAVGGFKDDFGGHTLTGNLTNRLQAITSGIGPEGQRDWWAQFKAADNTIRNQLFGSALTPSEQKAYESTTIEPNMDPKEIRRNLNSRREIVRKAMARKTAFLKANGFDHDPIVALAGEYAGDFSPDYVDQVASEVAADPEQQAAAAIVPGEGQPKLPGDIGFSGKAPATESPWSPTQVAAYDAFMAANPKATAEQIEAFGTSIGAPISNAAAIVEAREAGAGVAPGEAAVAGLTPEEQAEVQRRVDEAGGFMRTSAGVADAATLGLSNKLIAAGRDLTGKGEYDRELMKANAITDQIAAESPLNYYGGNLLGGAVLPIGAARTPMQLAKVGGLYGAGYGLGSSDRLVDVPGNLLTGGAVGAATGGIGGKLAQEAGGWLANRAASRAEGLGVTPSLSPAERYARAQQFGIEPSMGDVGGQGAKIIEKGLDILPASATTMQAGRTKLAGQVDEAVAEVAKGYGPETGFRGLGEAAIGGVKGKGGWSERLTETADKLYNKVDIPPEFQATVDKSLEMLRSTNTRFQSNPDVAKLYKNKRFVKLAAALEKSGLSWSDMNELRSEVGDQLARVQFQKGSAPKALKSLYKGLSDDMRATAAKHGDKSLKSFERANAFWQRGQTKIEDVWQKLLGKNLDDTPEAVAARIKTIVGSGSGSADLKLVQELWKGSPKEVRAQIANGIIGLMGKPLGKEGADFNPTTFAKNWQGMDKAAKNLIFGDAPKELRKNLDDFVGVMGDLAATNALRNTSQTAAGTAGAGTIGTIAGAVMNPVLGAKLLAMGGLNYAGGRAWTNPGFVRFASGYGRMLRKAAKTGEPPSPDQARTQLRLLDRLLTNEPALQPDIQPVRDMLNGFVTGEAGPAPTVEPEPIEPPAPPVEEVAAAPY